MHRDLVEERRWYTDALALVRQKRVKVLEPALVVAAALTGILVHGNEKWRYGKWTG